MFKIKLINMPFASVNRPSLSLTQLKGLIYNVANLDIKLHYLNQDFAKFLGLELFRLVSNQNTTGLGDWLFREIAFPYEEDNTKEYLERHFPSQDQTSTKLRNLLMTKRRGFDGLLDALIDKYDISNSNLVGFTSMFSQNVACFALAKKLKTINPNLIVVMGGANCETPMGEEIVKNVPQIDFVFSGPALITFPKLVESLGKGNIENCHSIRGVFSKRNVDNLSCKQLIGKDKSINDPVILNYDSFIKTYDENFPDRKEEKLLLFETSRGCWWGERSHCTFCGLNSSSMGFRAMDSKTAVQLFEDILSYSKDCSHFSSVDNILPLNYARDVFPHIDPPNHVDIFYEVKTSLKKHELQLLSNKRIKRVQPGIESLSTSTLRRMKKGSTAFQNIIFLINCVLYDIFPSWNLLIGFPGEQENVYKKYVTDIPLLSHLPPPEGCFPVRFDRFSPYFDYPSKFALDLSPYDFYEYVYPFSKKSLSNIAYYFQDRNYKSEYFISMTKWLDSLRRQISTWNSLWYPDDNKILPELYFMRNELIYDSRSGQPCELKISEIENRVLSHLTKPKSIPALITCMLDVNDFETQQTVFSLQTKKLIFEEEGKYLSLVLPQKGSNLKAQFRRTKNSFFQTQ